MTFIPIPQNSDEAEVMQKLGYTWLQKNNPNRLTGLAKENKELCEALDEIYKLTHYSHAEENIRTLIEQYRGTYQEEQK